MHQSGKADGMQFDNDSVDTSRIDDRRGRGGGAPLAIGGGGLGIVGVVIFVLVQVLGGGSGGTAGSLGLDPSSLGLGTGTAVQGAGAESAEQFRARCNTAGALNRDDDCFLAKIDQQIDTVWTAELPKHNVTYTRAKLAFYTGTTDTKGCGGASAQVGPFYCPGDQEVYIDLDFLAELQQKFGADGRYAQAYILAHEVGHHLQTLLGTEPKVRDAQQRSPGQTNALSVSLELQADCYAGVWGRLANDAKLVTIDRSELQQALDAAAAVGDDRIQKQIQGKTNPESYTHGTAQQRSTWYQKGYDTADIDACTTFDGATAPRA